MSWYAIFVETGKEDEVCKRIRKELSQTDLDGRFELLVPRKRIVERRNGVFGEVERKIFPGYVLIHTECINEVYYKTFKLEHLYRYLRRNGLFEEIRLEEIANIVYMANAEGVIGVSDIFIESDAVKVMNGPLCNYRGWVVKIDKHKRRARVLFRFSGQDHLIDLSVNILEKVNDQEIKNEIQFRRMYKNTMQV